MNILGTTITTSAELTTERANYKIAYSITDNTLKRLHTEVFQAAENGEQTYIGYITYEGQNMHCSIEGNGKNSLYFADFETILATASEGLTNEISSTNNEK